MHAYALRYAWGHRKIWALTVAEGYQVSMPTVHGLNFLTRDTPRVGSLKRGHMTLTRRCKLLLGLVLVSVWSVAVAVVSAAPALAVSYCGHGVSAYSWCSDAPIISGNYYDSNRADYPGNGSVYVCEYIRDVGYPGGQISYRCGYNHAYSYSDAFNYFGYMQVWVGNGSPNFHTINGHYYCQRCA